MRKRLCVASAVMAALAVVSVAAAASGKQRLIVDQFSDSYSFAVDCADFGPYDFENLVSGRERIQVTDVLSRDGTLLQTVFQMHIDETDENSETGFRLPLKGAVHEVWDYASNTRTLSGVVFIGTSPGGTYVQDTGRITMTLDTREAQFVAGPHEAFVSGGIDPVVCAALADG